MPSTLAAADAILKVGYGDIHEQLDNFIVALELVEGGSSKLTFDGVQAQFAIHTGRNQGVGALNEMEDLPDAGQNTDARASVYLKYQYGRIQGTGQVFSQVTGNATSFVDWMNREMSEMKTSLAKDLSRQVYGDGTGTLALLTAAATTATTLTVDDAHWIEIGTTIDVLTQATLANVTPTKGNTALLTVTAVDPIANTVTVSGGTATAAIGSALVRARTNSNNWKREWEGLGMIVSNTTTLHGINPSTTPVWKPGYVEAGVGVLAEVDFTHLIQGIRATGAATPDTILTTYGVVNSYWNTLQALRRYNGNDNLAGGVTKPVFQSVFGDVSITSDFDCPVGTAYAVNKKEMFLHRVQDWSWMDKTGSIWQQVPNKDAFNATIFQYSNIGVYRRQSFGKLTGITEQ
jgi:hypothetical protein